MTESKNQPSDTPEDGDVRVKVTDRRKFNSHGMRREDAAPEEDQESDPPPPPAPAASPTHAAEREAPATRTEAREDPGRTAGQGDASPGQVDFQSFVYFLYMSALHELGIPTQEGAAPRPADLERARFFVEVLGLLETKTKGNLEPGESKLLEEALYNLRMQYVGISQKSTP